MDVSELIGRMNVRMDLEDDDLVTDVVVIAKVLGADGEVSLGLAISEGTNWLDELALLTAAQSAFNEGYSRSGED